jgi:hypothetical protein
MANKSRTRGQQSQAKKVQAEYSLETLEKDLDEVRSVYDAVTATRAKSAIYQYWHAVYGLARKWRRLKKKGVNVKKVAKPMLKARMPPSSGDDSIRFIVNATSSSGDKTPAGRTKLNKLRSKYSALLNNAYEQEVTTRDLVKFIKEHGGLNFKRGK